MDSQIFENIALNRLARRMQKGDERAAEDLYTRLVGKVFGFCMNRVRSKEIAEDLTQDIFLKLVNRIETFDVARGNFLGWFWQLARNTVLDHYRSSKEKNVSLSEFSEAEQEKLGSYDERGGIEKRFEVRHMLDFVRLLSQDEQELFELRFIAGLPYGEMAKVLGKNEGNLRVAVSRLKGKIKTYAKGSNMFS